MIPRVNNREQKKARQNKIEHGYGSWVLEAYDRSPTSILVLQGSYKQGLLVMGHGVARSSKKEQEDARMIKKARNSRKGQERRRKRKRKQVRARNVLWNRHEKGVNRVNDNYNYNYNNKMFFESLLYILTLNK